MGVITRSVGIAVGVAGLGLGASMAARAQDTATARQPLLGPVSQSDDCSPQLQRFNEDIMRYGRVTAATRAFEQCVDRDVRALYRKCTGDPYYGSTVATQISRVIAASRSPSSVQIRCTGGDGNASTGLGSYGDPAESFSWGGWFTSVQGQLSRPVCGAGQNPGDHNCRYAAAPWPYSQAAGIVWHEVMHTQGYTHGANEQPAAKVACGYATDATWHFQTNTMPYILGNCVSQVIDRSAQRCGDVERCPGSSQLRLVTSFAGSTCACVNDPGKKGLGLLDVRDGRLVDRAMVPEEDWIGGWHYGRSNAIHGSGDFDGDRVADFVVTSSWGLGILSRGGDHWRALVVKPNGARLGGWNLNTARDQIHGVADFDGDGKDDLVLSSGWGLGILRRSGTSMTHVMMAATGTHFGGWNFNVASDKIRGIGDFDGNGKADLLVTSGWGVGLLTLSGSTLTPLTMVPTGTRLGGWVFNATTDRIHGIADFDGDGKDDILVSSGWGIGILTLRSGALTHLLMQPSGTGFDGWNYAAASDKIAAIGDFNGDRTADILIRSGWGMALLTRSGGTLGRLASQQGGQWIDGWNFNAVTDQIVSAGDLDGNGADDLLIRSGWGTGVIRRDGSGKLRLIDARANGELFGSWQLAASDKVAGVDHFIPGETALQAPRGGLLLQK